MKLDKLLQLDINPRDAADGAFKHNRNVLLSEGMQSIENEGGFELEYRFGEHERYLGYIPCGNDFVIFVYEEYENIYECILKVYLWQKDKLLEPVVNYYTGNNNYGEATIITGTFTLINNERIIIFTSDVKKEPTRIINIDRPEKRFNRTLFNPVVPLADIDIKVSSGTLPSGTYYVSINYGQDYVESSFMPVFKKILVGYKVNKGELRRNVDPIDDYKFYEGFKDDQTSNQGILLNIQTNQQIYNRVSIGIIHDNGKAKNAYVIRDILLSNGNLTHAIYNLPKLATSEESIVLSKNIYTYFNSMAIARNKLYVGGVGSPRITFKQGQDIANKCTIQFKTRSLDLDEDTLNATTFVPNEVYAAYIYLFDDRMIPLGIWNIKAQYKFANIEGEVYIDTPSGPQPAGWKVHKNINEYYPNTPEYGTIAGSNVQHFYVTENIGHPNNRIEAELIIPDSIELPSCVKHIGVGYAKRTHSNSRVIGTDLITHSHWAETLDNMPLSYGQGHNYKLLTYKLTLDTISHTTVIEREDETSYSANSNYQHNVPSTIHMFSDGSEYPTASVKCSYVANDVILGENDEDNHDKTESHIQLNAFVPAKSRSSRIYLNLMEDYYHGVLSQNVILQNVITLDKDVANSSWYKSCPFKGDSYIGTYSVRQTYYDDNTETVRKRILTYWTQSDIPLIRTEGGAEFEKVYPITTAKNVLDLSKYPAERDNYVNTDTGKSFNDAYASRNEYYVNPSQPTDNEPESYPNNLYYENKIVKTAVHNQESKLLGFTTIAASDYFSMPMAMGLIIALMSDGYSLYIQQMYELFIASVKDVISGQGQESLYIGEGDLFDRPPRPIVYDETGHIGCSSPLHCKLGSLGYIVADKARGRMFLINGDTPLEISNLDSRLYIENKLKTNDIRVGFDYKSKRVFLHLLNDKISLSTHAQVMRHVSFHDYAITNTICAGINTLYMVDNKLVIPTPSKNYGKYGDWIREGTDDNIKSSFVDMYYTQAVNIAKLIQTVRWKTISNLDDVDNYNDTIDSIMMYNDTQCTGNLVVNKNPMFFDSASGKLANTAWYFNDINDAVLNDTLPFLDEELQPIPSNVDMAHKDWFNVSKFICDWAVVRLLINNVVQRKIIINSCEIIAQKDSR